jgi:branched-chain amino acid aminotransferase
MSAKFIWMDGDLLDWNDATVHVSSFGLYYGIGWFEGIRCHSTPAGPAIFRLTDHLRRLHRSAAVYGFSVPYSVEDLAQACRSVVAANGLSDCYLRPLVTLGDGDHPLTAKFRTAVIATEDGPLAGAPKDKGVTARISSFQRMSANSIPPASKATGQYLNSLLAQGEAITSGCDEAILLNADGFVTDGWAHNVFVVADGMVITPPLTAGALPGITRETIMTLAADDGVAVAVQNVVRSDLYLAQECFMTGTSAGLVPVVSVDGRTIGDGQPGPVASRLRDKLAEVTHGATRAYPQWRELVA